MNRFLVLVVLISISVSVSAQSKKGKSMDALYRNPQVPAQFPGCQDKDPEYQQGCSQQNLTKYLKDKMKYPKTCLKDSIEGISFVSMVVDTMGKISQIRIDKKAPHADMDKDALRLIKSMNKMKQKWVPAKHLGKKVISQTVVPVKFRIKPPKPAPAPIPDDSH